MSAANDRISAVRKFEATGTVINEYYTQRKYIRRRHYILGIHPDWKVLQQLLPKVYREAEDVYHGDGVALSVQEVRRRELDLAIDPLTPLPTTDNTQTIDDYQSYGKLEWTLPSLGGEKPAASGNLNAPSIGHFNAYSQWSKPVEQNQSIATTPLVIPSTTHTMKGLIKPSIDIHGVDSDQDPLVLVRSKDATDAKSTPPSNETHTQANETTLKLSSTSPPHLGLPPQNDPEALKSRPIQVPVKGQFQRKRPPPTDNVSEQTFDPISPAPFPVSLPLKPSPSKKPRLRDPDPTSADTLSAIVAGTSLPTTEAQAIAAASLRRKNLLLGSATSPMSNARHKPRKTASSLSPEFFTRPRSQRSSSRRTAVEVQVVRCICGATQDTDIPGEEWIACDGDGCGVWQHVRCVGNAAAGRRVKRRVEGYLCHQCDPWRHREEIARLRRGEARAAKGL